MKLTNKITAIILLLLICVTAFSSCAAKTSGSGDNETSLDKLLKQIDSDYLSELKKSGGYDPDVDGVFRVKNYYGTYNDCVPVMFSMPETGAMRDVEVAGVVFHYTGSNTIIVWRDGDFFSLNEAYELELLTKDHIEAIASLHNSGKYTKR